MKQFPAPGEENIMLAHMRAEAEEKLVRQAHEAEDEAVKKEEREAARFRKAHPDLFTEPDAVGEAITVNGEAIERPEDRKKKRTARLYQMGEWIRKWGVLIGVLVLAYLAIGPIPVHIHKVLPYVKVHNNEMTTGTLEITGWMRHYVLMDDYFHVRITYGDESEEITATIHKSVSKPGVRELMVDKTKSYSRAFQHDWCNEWTPPRVEGFFRQVLIYYSQSDYLAAPAENEDEALAVIQASDFLYD